jgi:hypothetical protein
MADNNRPDVPKVDRRGTSIFVPIGIAVVFVALAVLMLVRNSPQGTPPPPLGESAAKTPGPK